MKNSMFKSSLFLLSILLMSFECYGKQRNVVSGDERKLQFQKVQMCAKSSDTEYKTMMVPQYNVERRKKQGWKVGKCSDFCAMTLCNHKPCYDDYNLTGEKCTCVPTGTSKCTGVNTRCSLNDESCQCNAGYAGNASTAVGCPDFGFSLPDLPYKTDALEPSIDNRTMYIHHTKHHQTYVTNLNRAVNGTANANKTIVELQPGALAAGTTIRNNAGGHYNHAFFWKILSPTANSSSTKRSAQLDAFINGTFGNITNLITNFNSAATPGALFGSGWVWLCVNLAGDKLLITTTPNQDNPLMVGVKPEISFPILGLDVWEHAYYLKYQNLRNDYVANFWNVVNWYVVSEFCKYAVEHKAGVPV